MSTNNFFIGYRNFVVKDSDKVKSLGFFEDLTGRIFNHLTVIKREPNYGTAAVWLCKCSCGKLKKARAAKIKAGEVKSCGCLNKKAKTFQGQTPVDLTGLKIHNWKIISQDPSGKKGSRDGRFWLCECICGKKLSLPVAKIKSLRSCGCSSFKKGEDSYRWNGGEILKYNIRQCYEMQNWINKVLKRDDYSCQSCGVTNSLHVHHIIYFSTILKQYEISSIEKAFSCELLWDIKNGITLCVECHKDRHREENPNK